MADERLSDPYESSPCGRHELDPQYASGETPSWEEIKRWRHHQRRRLVDARLALSASDHQAQSSAITDRLERTLSEQIRRTPQTIGVYWPIRNEPDLLPLMRQWTHNNIAVALPVVVEPNQPLAFRAWTPDAPMAKGIWDIPVPATETPASPTIVIAPCVGFDAQNHRLGYGGGFYDRTLQALETRPLFVGVAFAQAQLHAIYPQPNDIPCDVVVTDEAVIEI